MTTVATDISRPGGLRNDLAPTSDFPTPHGLFSVAQTPALGDPHWVTGIDWEHSSCAPVSGTSGWCEDTELGLPYTFPNTGTVASATPFTLFGTYKCGPVGSPPDRAADYARLNLERHEQEGVEDAISSGALSTAPTFATAVDLTPTAGTAVSPAHAMGLLAQHAGATFGTAGTIHAPRVAYAALHGSGLIERDGDTLRTISGDLVSAGAGYSNASPDGTDADAGTAWLYVTPPVILLRSEILDTPPTTRNPNRSRLSVLDWTSNDLYAIAERHYLVGWDDCQIAAVLVDIT